MPKAKYEDAPEYDERYTVAGYGGVAWFVRGWEIEPDEDTEWSGCYNRTGHLVCTMVGDDRCFTFEPEELTLLGETDYCASCGQVGCTADGRER